MKIEIIIPVAVLLSILIILLLFFVYRRKFGFSLPCCNSNVEKGNNESKVSVAEDNLPIINQIPQQESSFHIENEVQRDVSNSLNVHIDTGYDNSSSAFTPQLCPAQIPQLVLDKQDDGNGSIEELNLSIDMRDARAEEQIIGEDKNEFAPSESFSDESNDYLSIRPLSQLSPISSLPLDDDDVPRMLKMGIKSLRFNAHKAGGQPSTIVPIPVHAHCLYEPEHPAEDQIKTFTSSIETKILELQKNLKQSNSPESVRQVQDLLLKLKNTSEESTQCKLIIGVDSTPRIQAGYCVNLEEKSLQYYIVKREDLPWILHGDNDPAEFEMKNLIFALTVWKGDITKYKRIRIYTDNFSVNHPKARYGGRASTLLEHYANCENVVIINRSDIAVNRFKNLKYFAKYIQPADDFSRWHIREAVMFLKKLYGIHDENIYGTHKQENFKTRKPWYGPTPLYQRLLQKAEDIIRIQLCSDPNCSRLLKLSLRVKRNAARVRKIH